MSRLLPVVSRPPLPGVWLVLLALATGVDGLLSGASLDQSIKQLPARHRIGVLAFSAYSRASDQANGVLWYAALGVGGAVLTLAAAASTIVVGAPLKQRWPVLLAGGLAVAHSFATLRAAPINFSQRRVVNDEPALRDVFDRFERWQTARAVLQLGTFAAMLTALVVIARGSADA